MNRDEFVKAFNDTAKRVLFISEKARSEGLLSIEDDIDLEKSGAMDIFEFGLPFAVHENNKDLVKKYLTNLIHQEKDEYVWLLKTLQIEAVWAIQAGTGLNEKLKAALKHNHDKDVLGFTYILMQEQVVWQTIDVEISQRKESMGIKDVDKAITEYTEALKRNPNDVSAKNILASAYYIRSLTMEAEDENAVIKNYGEAIKYAPNDFLAYYMRGFNYYRNGDINNAIADFEEIIGLKSNPNTVMDENLLTRICMQCHLLLNGMKGNYDYELAFQYFKKIFKSSFIDSSETDTDISDHSEVFARYSAKPFYYRGCLYKKKKEWDSAIADFSKAILYDPNDAEYYYERGVAYSEKKEWDSAIADFSKAISYEPNDPRFYHHRGLIYSVKKEWDSAIADFSKAISYEPNNAKHYYYLGIANSVKKEWDSAIADFSKAISYEPNNAQYYYYCGVAYSVKEEWDSAIDDFNKAISYDPNNAEFYYRRAEAYRRTDQERLALPDLKKALQLNPEHKKAQKTLRIMDLAGDRLGLNNKDYIVICNKIINNRECVIVLMKDPKEIKILNIWEENEGELHASPYEGEDEQEIIKASGYEIIASIKEIKEKIEKSTEEGK